MQDNNNIKMKRNKELSAEIQCGILSDRSKMLIEQMKEKLSQCEKKAVQRINELDLVLSREGLQDRAQTEIMLWQEKYKVKQELKEDSFRNKILDKLKRWNI